MRRRNAERGTPRLRGERFALNDPTHHQARAGRRNNHGIAHVDVPVSIHVAAPLPIRGAVPLLPVIGCVYNDPAIGLENDIADCRVVTGGA
ncbi:MAG: hypothetical protein M5U01_19270 [Ardenticatenaceae bacterium]|nr:hypothetical protein [Ardenticatenaceae bacterium]HBY99407.1 hypothetical protein [Chloroflexota bacterium]